ncbi:MAG: ABC transporter permease [Flavobacteriales bacterium]
MNLRLAFQIARTHLLAKKKQTLVAMLGVTFGISMFIVMISFMTGVNDFLFDIAIDGSPHVRLYNPIESSQPSPAQKLYDSSRTVMVSGKRPKNELPRIKNGLKIAAEIAKMPGVTGVLPQAVSQVFFNNGPVQLPVTIVGTDADKEIQMYGLDKKMESGNIQDMKTGDDALLLGSGLAEKMNIRGGDRFSVTTPEGGVFMLKVAGTFSTGVGAIDDTRAYADLKTVQKLLNKNADYITDIHIRLNDKEAATDLKDRLTETYGYKAEDWKEANAALLAGESIRYFMTAVISLTLLIVAGFGIYNIMNMNIINKMRDIAILKATGFEGRDVVAIFLLQALLIGFFGGLLGLLIGFFFSYLISLAPFPAGGIFKVETFPVNFKTLFYLSGLWFGMVTTLFAGYFPSRKAARIDPVEIIRG